MLLKGRSLGWFSSKIELTLNGNVIGIVRPKWFSEGLDLELLQQPVRFEKPSWLKSHFVLKDEANIELGSATLEGFLGRCWKMNLKSGAGDLVPAGWFTSEYILRQGASITARVGLSKWFSRSWEVNADDTLTAVDLLLIGLVYTVIRHRIEQQQS